MVIKYAANWKQLGRNLEIDNDLLDIIETDFPNDCESCCSKMLSDWLKLTPNASWEMLYAATDNMQREIKAVPDAFKKLSTAVDYLPVALDKLGSAADTLPDTAEKLGNAASILPNTINQPCEAVNKLSEPVGKIHVPEHITLDNFTGT